MIAPLTVFSLFAGVYTADSYREVCIQAGVQSWRMSEDCLFLNIWKPAGNRNNLAVMVGTWAHLGTVIRGIRR